MSKTDLRKPPIHSALGKGLNSLLPSRNIPAPPPEGGVLTVPHGQIRTNPNQPRRDFDQQALLELAQSIEREGIIQPIIVRRMAANDYQIIAGERRWRAAGMAGLKEVPVVVREADDLKVLELAIIENIQREDLNPIELAVAFERMAAELSLSHEEIGQKTGKDRTTVTNSIRLLQLPPDVCDMVAKRFLSPGHARALLKLSTPKIQSEIATKAMLEGWSVRRIEDFTKPVRETTDEILPASSIVPKKVVDPNVRAAVNELERVLGTRVRILGRSRGKGRIEVEYYSDEELDRIYSLIVGSEPSDPAML